MRPDRATRKKVYIDAYESIERYKESLDEDLRGKLNVYICKEIRDALIHHYPEITNDNPGFNDIDFVNQLKRKWWPEFLFCAPFEWDYISAFLAETDEINDDYSYTFGSPIDWKLNILGFMIAMCESDKLTP